jgi:hypothetical protein
MPKSEDGLDVIGRRFRNGEVPPVRHHGQQVCFRFPSLWRMTVLSSPPAIPRAAPPRRRNGFTDEGSRIASRTASSCWVRTSGRTKQLANRTGPTTQAPRWRAPGRERSLVRGYGISTRHSFEVIGLDANSQAHLGGRLPDRPGPGVRCRLSPPTEGRRPPYEERDRSEGRSRSDGSERVGVQATVIGWPCDSRRSSWLRRSREHRHGARGRAHGARRR